MTSFVFASVFRLAVTTETPREDVEVILSIHFISFISLYTLSEIRLSISIGLVHGYAVDMIIVQSFTDGLDSLGMFIIATDPSIIRVMTTRYDILYCLIQKPKNHWLIFS
jgi:hypothetical protein